MHPCSGECRLDPPCPHSHSRTAFHHHCLLKPSQQSEPLRYQSETGNGSAATLFTTVAKQGESIWIVICTLLDLCLISFFDGACHPCRAGHALADICNASAVIWASYECIHSKVQSVAVSCNALHGILTQYNISEEGRGLTVQMSFIVFIRSLLYKTVFKSPHLKTGLTCPSTSLKPSPNP